MARKNHGKRCRGDRHPRHFHAFPLGVRSPGDGSRECPGPGQSHRALPSARGWTGRGRIRPQNPGDMVDTGIRVGPDAAMN